MNTNEHDTDKVPVVQPGESDLHDEAIEPHGPLNWDQRTYEARIIDMAEASALRITALEQLVKDYCEFIAGYDRLFHLSDGWNMIAATLEQRAKALVAHESGKDKS